MALAPHTMTAEPGLDLLGLPPDIRWLIYNILFPKHSAFILPPPPISTRGIISTVLHPGRLAILQTCRQIHLECRAVAFSRTTISLRVRPSAFPPSSHQPYEPPRSPPPTPRPPSLFEPPRPPVADLPDLLALATRVALPVQATDDILWALEAGAGLVAARLGHWTARLPCVTHVFVNAERYSKLKPEDVFGAGLAFPKVQVVAGSVLTKRFHDNTERWRLQYEHNMRDSFVAGLRELFNKIRLVEESVEAVIRKEEDRLSLEMRTDPTEEWRHIHVVLELRHIDARRGARTLSSEMG